MVTLKLAQVSLFLDQLGVMVFAVEPPLVRDVVRRADRAPSMGALEAALVISSSIYSNLKKHIPLRYSSDITYDLLTKCVYLQET